MQLIPIGAAYFVVHFIVFALVLRYLESFQSEREIFRYHAVSAAMVVLLAVLMIRREPSVAASAVAIVRATRLVQCVVFLNCGRSLRAATRWRFCARCQTVRPILGMSIA